MTHERLQAILDAAKDTADCSVFLGSAAKFVELNGDEMAELVSLAATGLAFIVLPLTEVEKLRITGRKLFKLDD